MIYFYGRLNGILFALRDSGVSFAAAACIFLNHKKAGPAVYVLAALIAFSRLYLFLHFPTDVLAGAVLGTLMGILSVRICENVFNRFLPG